ncbi:28S ribosomal protein S31, mitochondrial isoform X2 [Alosa sapidissima]|uniref:28S ribosomal protein S31, mitochondrial isoform X2 n=1 Tax=Alosa sapidissima TaxID=34773 RepID=UPI001C0915A6|nr:28S ribosomal protein S31, mitochondrial isoform X2 [Alosa sapidissima]
MHRKLITSYQCYKLLLSDRHINQLSQKSVLKSSLIGHSRFLSSSQSSEGDGGSRTSPATADGQSQSEVKESKDAVRKEAKEVKRDDQLHAAVVGEPQLHATAVEEPQLHATAVGEPVGEPQLQAAAVGESVGEPQLHATAVGEPQVQAAAVGEPVGEPQLQAAVVGEPVGEPQLQAAAVGEPVGEPELQAAAVGEPQVQAAAVGEPQLQAAAVGEPQVQAAAEPVGEPQLRDAAIGELVGQPQVQAAAELLGEPQLRDAAAMAAVSQVAMEAARNMAATPQAESSPASAQEREAKGGKKSLLELLGAMKVDVTTKRKVRTPRPLQSEQPMKSKAKPTIPVARDTTKGMFQEASAAAAAAAAVGENVEKETGLAPELVVAATAAASTLPNRGQATSELLRQLRRHEAQTHAQQQGGESISNIIADMKVGRRANGRLDARPSNQIRFDEDGRGYTHDRGITSELDGVRRRKSGFTGRRLNVFTTKPEDSPAVDAGLSLWDLDLGNRIAMATNQLPRNGFEEMLLWTKQGTFWQYPINNEAGLEEESSVPFHEHVFMEKHLSEGFPSQGPVRHFMELVVAGLAKNPYLTANQKQEHIAWFRGYFQEKQGVLEEAEVYNS